MDSKESIKSQSLKIQNDPSLFVEGAVFVGKIDKTEFKVLKVYQKGENLTEFAVADMPMVKLVETETGKTHTHSLYYLCHVLLDYKGVDNQKYNYYELVFAINGDENHTSSMCVLGYRKPSIEEAKEFWKEDCELYGDESLIEIHELTYEEAHGAFDMSDEAAFPIFGEEVANNV